MRRCPKKDYVGAWTSASGKSKIKIQSDGSLELVQDEGGTKETLTAPLAAFVGNDVELRMGVVFKIDVSVTPHQVGDRWEMTARGIKFHRS